jgi:hypothetical protein
MTEPVEVLNQRLIDCYGTTNDRGNWRVVWSEDQFEDRYGDYEDRTPEGILIRRVSEVRRVPKYRQWVPEKWCLETLMEVPFLNSAELPGLKLTYELVYAFPHRDGKPLMPSWGALRFLIEEINRKIGISTGPRYKDPESDPLEAREVQEQRLKGLQEELFGNETDIGDALAYKQGVGYTGTPLIKGES